MDFNIYDRKIAATNRAKNKEEQNTVSLPAFQRNTAFDDPTLYEVDEPLEDAVNLALNLGIPLLLTGAPGTGKTGLAYHLADFFGLGDPLVFYARTTSTAKELFYFYDSLAHFQFIQNQQNKALTNEEIENQFIRYQALGEAIQAGSRRVVLIDEIDKAPRDLPNDILAAIESLEFEVPEVGKVGDNKVRCDEKNRPIIILTSNSEKNLPDAFLRRVVYYDIPYPSAEKLISILGGKVTGLSEGEKSALVGFFLDLQKVKLKKKPATAEMIYWALALKRKEFPIEKLGNLDRLTKQELAVLKGTFSLLGKTREDLKTLKEKY